MRASPHVAALLLLSATLVAPRASAFCRTMTCELDTAPSEQCPRDDGCERDQRCCATVGMPLHWANPCLDFAVQLDGSALLGLDADRLAEVMLAAFERWQRVTCPGGGTPGFRARLAGFVTCDEAQTVCDRAPGNVRLIVARDGVWPHSPGQLALTTPTALLESGELIDTDMELNTHPVAVSVSGEPGTPGFEALENIVTHEVGHFLGLAHSDDQDALMYFAYMSSRPTDELLGADDVAGICAIFPPSKAALQCGESPGPAYDECQVPAADGSDAARGCIRPLPEPTLPAPAEKAGCSLATPGAPGWGSAASSTLASLIAFGIRRRRRMRP